MNYLECCILYIIARSSFQMEFRSWHRLFSPDLVYEGTKVSLKFYSFCFKAVKCDIILQIKPCKTYLPRGKRDGPTLNGSSNGDGVSTMEFQITKSARSPPKGATIYHWYSIMIIHDPPKPTPNNDPSFLQNIS